MADTFQNYPSGIESPARNAVAITPSDSTEINLPRAIYVGSTGNLTVLLASDTAPVTFVGVPAGALLPIRQSKVMATGTTETFLNETARDSIFIGPPILSASSNSGISGEIDIFRTLDRKQTVNSRVCDITGSSSNIKFESSGAVSPAANTALDGLRIQFNSGNIKEGGFYLYGLKTA